MPRVSLLHLVKSLFIVTLAIPLCAGIVVYSLCATAHALLVKDPLLPASDIPANCTFGGFGLLILLITLRAWLRIRREGVQEGDRFAWLTRAAPLLALLGAVCGMLFTRGVLKEQTEWRARDESYLCSRLLEARRTGLGEPAPEKLAACLPAAQRCLAAERASRTTSDMQQDFDYRRETICVREAGLAGGWFPASAPAPGSVPLLR
jgi:hypothetical protein